VKALSTCQNLANSIFGMRRIKALRVMSDCSIPMAGPLQKNGNGCSFQSRYNGFVTPPVGWNKFQGAILDQLTHSPSSPHWTLWEP
jgi:hypothetical protein